MGRHLGNVLVATVLGMRWAVGHHRNRAYIFQNQPVVTDGDGGDHNPLHSVAVIASKNLEGLTNGPASPRRYYDMRAAVSTPDAHHKSPAAATSTSAIGCGCSEHLDEVAGLTVPVATTTEADEPTDTPVTVADLVEWAALAVEDVEGEPDRWLLWFGDETRRHYDDDALLSLEDVVASAPGVSDVVREDRETILVRAPGRCADAMLAIAARALLDDRVRGRNASS